jgi:hypothetical protein
MQAKHDIPVLEFRVPSRESWRFALSPSVKGYKSRVALLRIALDATCAGAATLAFGMFLGRGVPPIAVIVPVAVGCLVVMAAVEYLRWRTEFCSVCGAQTKAPFADLRTVWCPACYNLSDPKQIIPHGSKTMDLIGQGYLSHSDPILRFLALVVLLAVAEGAAELRLVPRRDDYEVSIIVGDQVHRLESPPAFIQFAIAQTVRAIGGANLENWRAGYQDRFRISTSRRAVSADVTVEPTAFGQEVVLCFDQPAASDLGRAKE